MSDILNSENLSYVFSNIIDELPSLIGTTDWEKISHDFELKLEWLKKSKSETERIQLSSDLVEMIAPYSLARTRFIELIKILDPYNAIFVGVASIAQQIGIEKHITDQLKMVTSKEYYQGLKVMKIRKGGDKGKSIKLGNLDIDFAEMTELFASMVSTMAGIVGQTNYLLIAAGVLLITRSFHKALTIDLSEHEASVFWGFIHICDDKKISNGDDILKSTNHERKKIGLKPLSKEELKNALHKLASIKSVQPIEGRRNVWQIIEKHTLSN